MSTTITSKRLSAVLAFIVAFAVAAVMAISPAAFADAKQPIGNIDQNQTGTLHVHKYDAAKVGARGNGSELQGSEKPADERRLNGVQFSVFHINGIDLTKDADWAKLKTLKDHIADDGDITGVTNVSKGDIQGAAAKTVNGDATFSNLPFGAYIVVETDHSNVTNNNGQPTKVTTAVKPFIVTVPFPTDGNVAGANNGWLYDIHVYPKNEITDNPTKKLTTDKGLSRKNGELTWEINVPIPAIAKEFTAFKITDQLKNGSTTANATTATVEIEGATNQLVAADYELQENASKLVSITFNAKGLTKINANKGKKVVVTLHVKMLQDLANNKVVNDEYGLIYTPEGGGEVTVTPPTPPTDTPTAYFGDFKLRKVSSAKGANDTVANLKDAKFDVYANKADADAGTKSKAILTDLVSGDDGIVDIQDLFRGGSDTDTRNYYVRETVAPAGFVLPQGSNAVTEITVTKTSGTETAAIKPIENTPVGDLPTLPLTGAAGKVLLTLAGIAIVMLAAGTVLATRRRKA